MAGNQVAYGKAFEFACLLALHEALAEKEDVTIERSPQLETARGMYNGQKADKQACLMDAARAAVRVILRLEPQLEHPQENIPLYLTIQTDAKGIAGDVRDVLCIRRQNKWEIGLSCKHNHHAVKHSRLSATIDFGKEWLGVPCSHDYFDNVVPLFRQLARIRSESREAGSPALWQNIPDKAERYYKPILRAFLEELGRLAAENPEVPSSMIQYLIGRNDFYKVITDDRHRTTRVEAVNIAGTLNRPSGKVRSIVDIPLLKLPKRFYHMGFMEGSDNTVEVVCDEGWTVSMRIHNASSKVEPSLKFDVNLISLPSSIHAQVEPW